MQSRDTHMYTNASDLLVHPMKERNSDIRGTMGGLEAAEMGQPGATPFNAPAKQPQESLQKPFIAFGLSSSTPPIIDPQTMMQRVDEINAIQLMLKDYRTSG